MKNKSSFQIDPNVEQFFKLFFVSKNLKNPMTWFSYSIAFLTVLFFAEFIDAGTLQILIFGIGVYYTIVAWEKIQYLAVIAGLIALLNCPICHLDSDLEDLILFLSAVFFIIYWVMMTGFYKDFKTEKDAQKVLEQITTSVFGKTRDELTKIDYVVFSVFWKKEKNQIANLDFFEIGKLFNQFKAKYSEEINQFTCKNKEL